MYGIYIHFPFCKKKCYYCDFYSRPIDESLKKVFLNALLKEIDLRTSNLDTFDVETIYFGGGTPSLLDVESYVRIFSKLEKYFNIKENCEITIEANPQDIGQDYIKNLKSYTPINRISLGIQSFNNDFLKFLGRRQTAEDNFKAIETIITGGFENLSIDLIYAIPNQTLQQWENDLDIALQMPIKHLSAYSLTIEPHTVIWQRKNKGLIKEIDDDVFVKMYFLLLQKTSQKDFKQYEISNFAKEGYHSRHNLSYWQQKKYLGFGPSAHSYTGTQRLWNVANLKEYIEKLQSNILPMEFEQLTEKDHFNEYLITRFRTTEGIDESFLQKTYPQYYEKVKFFLEQMIQEGKIKRMFNKLSFTPEGILVSDSIFQKIYIL